MKIIINSEYKWKSKNIENHNIYYKGSYQELLPFIKDIIKISNKLRSHQLDNILNRLPIHCSAIIESEHILIAFTDHFGCYPLFYSVSDRSAISNSARKLNEYRKKSDWNRLSAEEFFMAGYVTGSNTLVHGLKRLQSGERIIVNRSSNQIDVARYYRYTQLQDTYRSDKDWVDEFEVVMDNIIQRMIDRSEGRPIKVPLSAGLDSRVIVSKLHEAKYDNFSTFSYGPPVNWEARGARIVANRLNAPWKLFATGKKEARDMFWSIERKKYWNFADNLSALPNFQEYYPISKLHTMGYFSKDSILINGQSGDFITGGHIPKVLLNGNSNVRTLLNEIINKHYALWSNLMTQDRLERIKVKILKLLGVSIDDKLAMEELVSLYERWEYEERQSKWVIHGQRVYDFFEYDWQLPLWDIELVRFYQRVPIHLKLDQSLYRLWLKRWNYKNLFNGFDPTIWRWPGATLAVVPLAKVTEVVLGDKAKQSLYKMFYYWGHTSDHYAPYSYGEYYKVRNLIRNSTALNGRVWAKENFLPNSIVDFDQ